MFYSLVKVVTLIMQKYGSNNKLIAQEGKRDELATILLEASRLVSELKGCQIYLVSKDIEEENTIWVTEVWDSKEDHAQSLTLDSVRALIMQAIPLLASQPEKGHDLEVIGGHGIN